MAIKSYKLLDHLKPTAPISVQVAKDKQVKLDTLPLWQPYLQMTFLDEAEEVTDYNPDSPTFNQKVKNKMKGRNRTIRLKLNSNTPYQEEQIEIEKIPANVPYTAAERLAVAFNNGVCETENTVVQRYLEAYPGFEGFKGFCNEISRPAYKLFDAGTVIKADNNLFKRRLAAANKIDSLDLKAAQDLLIRVFGVSYVPPDDLEMAQNVLVDYMDDAKDEGINQILRSDTNIDEEAKILIGRLVSKGILSFDAVEGQVVKKGKDGNWLNLKEISSEYSPFERLRYFTQFLTGPDGKLLMQDLKNELEGLTTTKSSPKK